MGNLSNSQSAKFSNPRTYINFDHHEYLGQSDSYGDIPGHGVFFPFLDLRVLWTLKSFLVLIFRMSSVDRKTNQQQWSEKPMGNTIQFVPSLLSAVYSVVVASYNFLTCEKHLIRFIETSFNYMQRKLLQRFTRWFNLYLQILLSAMQEMKILYILWREIFPVSHWRQSYFHSLVSLQQFILPFDVQSIFSLLVQQRWVSILFSAKYNEGNHLNIQSRNLHCKLFYSPKYDERYGSQFQDVNKDFS